jgi:hypothetical protein
MRDSSFDGAPAITSRVGLAGPALAQDERVAKNVAKN